MSSKNNKILIYSYFSGTSNHLMDNVFFFSEFESKYYLIRIISHGPIFEIFQPCTTDVVLCRICTNHGGVLEKTLCENVKTSSIIY